MKSLILALSGAAMVVAQPAFAGQDGAHKSFGPHSFSNLSDVFNGADLDDSSSLSRQEFRMMRTNMIDDSQVRSYRSDKMADHSPTIDRSFATLDRDNSGSLSASEFLNAANNAVRKTASREQGSAMNGTLPGSAGSVWSWQPEYMTTTYYLMANPVDTDTLEGRDVVNLDGEKLGKIDRIIKTRETGATDANRYYAMIDLQGSPRYSPTGTLRDTAGVPLNDVLLYNTGSALMLSSRGEDYLRDTAATEIDDFEVVETLYGV